MKRLSAMRWIVVAVGCAAAAIQPVRAEDVEIGAARESVIDQLGEPDGSVILGDTEVLYYTRGQVDLEDGKVVRARVLSEAEYQAEEQRKAEEAEARRIAAEEAAARRHETGQKKLASVRENNTLAGKSAGERLAYWKKFQRQYPGVDVGTEINEAQAAVDEIHETQAAVDKKVQERMEEEPPEGLSRSKLRRYQRGRSESAIAERETEIREQVRKDMGL